MTNFEYFQCLTLLADVAHCLTPELSVLLCPRSPATILERIPFNLHCNFYLSRRSGDLYLSRRLDWQVFNHWRRTVGSSFSLWEHPWCTWALKAHSNHPVTHQDLLWIMMIKGCWQLVIARSHFPYVNLLQGLHLCWIDQILEYLIKCRLYAL